MKKTIAVICILILLFSLTSCTGYRAQGIDHLIEKHGIADMGLDRYFLYDFSFIEDYPYVDAEYYLHRVGFREEESFLYLIYEAEIYAQAKEALLTNTYHARENPFEYQGFIFYVNLSFELQKEFYNFPEFIGMIGYHDEAQTIIVFAIYDSSPPSNLDNDEQFGKMLEEKFSLYYSFAEHKPLHYQTPEYHG